MKTLLRQLCALVLVLVVLFGSAVSIRAQDESPFEVYTPPVSLHDGTCSNPELDAREQIGELERQEFGEVRDDIDDDLGDQQPLPGEAEGDGVITDDIDEVSEYPAIWKAEGEVGASFEELFTNPHVIAVHASPDAYGTLIACGHIMDIEWQEENQLVMGLRPMNDSGFYGYAILERDTDNIPIFGENTTGVTVYLFERLPSQGETRSEDLQLTPNASS